MPDPVSEKPRVLTKQEVFDQMLIGKWPFYVRSLTPSAPLVEVAELPVLPGASVAARMRHALYWFLYASRSPLNWPATGVLAVLVIGGGMAILLVAGASDGRHVSFEHGVTGGAVALLVYGVMTASDARPGFRGRQNRLQQWLRRGW